jgi:hypothetical protein
MKPMIVENSILDPHGAWLLLVDAMESGHWRVVREQADDLVEWIELGGLPPAITSKATDPAWNRQVVLFGCKLAGLIARRRLRG